MRQITVHKLTRDLSLRSTQMQDMPQIHQGLHCYKKWPGRRRKGQMTILKECRYSSSWCGTIQVVDQPLDRCSLLIWGHERWIWETPSLQCIAFARLQEQQTCTTLLDYSTASLSIIPAWRRLF